MNTIEILRTGQQALPSSSQLISQPIPTRCTKNSSPRSASSLGQLKRSRPVALAAPFAPRRLSATLNKPKQSSVTTKAAFSARIPDIRLPLPSIDASEASTDVEQPTASTPPPSISLSTTSPPPQQQQQPILSCAGGGIFFFWELGAIKYLEEHYNLNDVQLIGCSAGALVGTLLACGVAPDRALKSAFRLSVENDIWNRPGGLAGIWGSIIRDWLQELLPEDAASRCNGRVKLIATEVPKLGLKYLDRFETKEDVINACMASVHIPFFLDGNATCELDGNKYIDGSLWDFLSGDNSALIKCNGAACIIDYFYDDQLQYSRLDFIKLAQFDEVEKLMKAGYDWAARTDAEGAFDGQLGGVKKWALRRWAEYPLIQLTRALA